jgi:pimeloyl-ACP methyl ester carboxylesterase
MHSDPPRIVNSRGATIAYTVRGSGDPVAVFLHGWGCRGEHWNGVIDHLGAPGTFAAIDVAGHGASSKGYGPWTMERLADDVLAVADEEGWSNIVLVGHSMGAAVAVEVARRRPGIARSVIAVDALSHLATYRANPTDAVEAMKSQLSADLPAAVRSMMSNMFSADGDPALKHATIEGMASLDPEVGVDALSSLLFWDMDEALAATDVPVAVLAARAIMPPEAPAALAPRCDVRPVDLEGHFFLLESPRETAAEIRGLLTDGPVSSPA